MNSMRIFTLIGLFYFKTIKKFVHEHFQKPTFNNVLISIFLYHRHTLLITFFFILAVVVYILNPKQQWFPVINMQCNGNFIQILCSQVNMVSFVLKILAPKNDSNEIEFLAIKKFCYLEKIVQNGYTAML